MAEELKSDQGGNLRRKDSEKWKYMGRYGEVGEGGGWEGRRNEVRADGRDMEVWAERIYNH